MPILEVLLLALPILPQSPDLELKPEGCHLEVGGRTLSPVRSAAGVGDVRSEGGWEIEVKGHDVLVRRPGSSETRAKVRATANDLECRAIASDCAWFDDSEAGVDSPVIQRLDLNQCSWLPKLTLGDKELGLEKRQVWISTITCLLPDGAGLFALREDLIQGQDGAPEAAAYVVTRLDPTSGRVEWARRFPCATSIPGSGAVLLAPMLTTPFRTSTRPLQRFGTDLLVCAAGAESLVLLGTEKGETKWSVDRLWEFQRGYIGPSVWSHYLARFGIDSFGGEDDAHRKAIADSRARFEALYSASVTAGPFIIRKEDTWGKAELAALVVVSLAPHDRWAEQLTQQFVYEVDARGKPCSVVALPRAMLGWAASPSGDRVVFACLNGGFGCVSSTENTGDIGSVGTAPDATGTLSWYRELAPATREAWMSCDPAADTIAFLPELGVRPAGGGWIGREGDSFFHFPLWLVDPRDGSAREVELLAPFEGQMSKPTTNFRSDAKGMHTWGMRGLGITYLRFDGGRLCVWLANSKKVWRLEFDARELLPAK